MSNFVLFPKPTYSSQVGTAKTAVAARPCEVFGWVVQNNTAAIAYIQVFDQLAGNVTVGTTVPDYVIPVPSNGEAVLPLSEGGFTHTNGLTIAATTGAGNAVAATCDVLMFVR